MVIFLLLVLAGCTSSCALWFFFPEKILAWAYQIQQKQRMTFLLSEKIDIPSASGILVFKQNTILNAIILRNISKTPITIVLASLSCNNIVLKLLWKNHINIISPKEVYTWNEKDLLLMSINDYKLYKKPNNTMYLGCVCGNVNFHYDGRKRLISQYFQMHVKAFIPSCDASISKAIKRLETHGWFDYIDKQPPLITQWIKQAKLGRKSLSIADSTGTELNHHRLLTAVLSFTSQLKTILSDDDTVGVCLPASVGASITTLSLLCLNKVIVNINYTASKSALLSAINQSNLTKMITSYRFIEQLKKKGFDIANTFNDIELVYFEDIKQTLTKVTLFKNLLLSKFLPSRLITKRLNIQKRPDSDPMFIIFSSGSEGSPKGVKLSHNNILGNIKQASSLLMEVEQNGTLMSTLPIFHAFGLTATLLLPLLEGIPFVCHPDPRDSVAIGHLVNQYKATILFGTSTFLRLYAKSRRLTPSMFKSLKLIVTGAERLLPEVRTIFECKFNKLICEGYGTTELSPVVSSNITHKTDEAPNKLGTVGQPIPGCEIRIVHPETLEEQACGEPGHILVGGVNVMVGYLNNAAKTASVLVNHDKINWYKTGDKGFLDTEGYLSILGRYSRFAKLGGEMVSLYAIEKQIIDVINDENVEILATCIADKKKGEAIVLLFCGPISTDELNKMIIKSTISNLMKPQHYLKLDAIPTLGSGKIDFSAAKKYANKAFSKLAINEPL